MSQTLQFDSNLPLHLEFFHISFLEELIEQQSLHKDDQHSDPDDPLSKEGESESDDQDNEEYAEPVDYVRKRNPVAQENSKTVEYLVEELISFEERLLETLRILKDIRDEIHNNERLKQNAELIYIFRNIRSLYELHVFLNADLGVIKMDTSLSLVPSSFTDDKEIPFLSIHKDFIFRYAKNYPDFIKFYRRDTEFSDICRKVVLTSKYNEQHLQDACGMYFGVQSCITRYKLLISKMEKYLSPSDSRLPDVKKAAKVLDGLLTSTQDAVKRQEQINKSRSILLKVDGLTNVPRQIPPLIREGPVKKVPRRAMNRRLLDRHMFLFSEFILITENPSTSFRLQAKLEMSLIGMQITDIDECELPEVPNCFRIHAKESCVEISFPNVTEKSEWLDAIEPAIVEANSNCSLIPALSSMAKDAGEERAAEWVKDEQCAMCAFCGTNFTVINRRHHCRACGKVFCGNCSGYRAPIVFLGGKWKRVCVVDYYLINSKLKPPTTKIMEAMLQRNNKDQPHAQEGYLAWSLYSHSSWLSKPLFRIGKRHVFYEQVHSPEISVRAAKQKNRLKGISKVTRMFPHAQKYNLNKNSVVEGRFVSHHCDIGVGGNEELDTCANGSSTKLNNADMDVPSGSDVSTICMCRIFCVLNKNARVSLYVTRVDAKPWEEFSLIGKCLIYLDDTKSNLLPCNNSFRIESKPGNPHLKTMSGEQQRKLSYTIGPLVPHNGNITRRPTFKNDEKYDSLSLSKTSDNRYRQQRPPPVPRKPYRSAIIANMLTTLQECNPVLQDWVERHSREDLSFKTDSMSDKCAVLSRTRSNSEDNIVVLSKEKERTNKQLSLYNLEDIQETLPQRKQDNGDLISIVNSIPQGLLNILRKQHSFIIWAPTSACAHYFKAPTLQIRTRWMNAIRDACINKLKKG